MPVLLAVCLFPRCSGQILKKLLESIKDLVNEANFDCSSAGMSLQGTTSTLTDRCSAEQ